MFNFGKPSASKPPPKSPTRHWWFQRTGIDLELAKLDDDNDAHFSAFRQNILDAINAETSSSWFGKKEVTTTIQLKKDGNYKDLDESYFATCCLQLKQIAETKRQDQMLSVWANNSQQGHLCYGYHDAYGSDKPWPSYVGGQQNKKQSIRFQGRRYVVRRDKGGKYILKNRARLHLKDIKNQYTRVV